jgi:hypothetical protein
MISISPVLNCLKYDKGSFCNGEIPVPALCSLRLNESPNGEFYISVSCLQPNTVTDLVLSASVRLFGIRSSLSSESLSESPSANDPVDRNCVIRSSYIYPSPPTIGALHIVISL